MESQNVPAALISRSRSSVVQVVLREQALVRPPQGIPPNHNLPTGVKTDAVQNAASLPMVLKQVSPHSCLHV